MEESFYDWRSSLAHFISNILMQHLRKDRPLNYLLLGNYLLKNLVLPGMEWYVGMWFWACRCTYSNKQQNLLRSCKIFAGFSFYFLSFFLSFFLCLSFFIQWSFVSFYVPQFLSLFLSLRVFFSFYVFLSIEFGLCFASSFLFFLLSNTNGSLFLLFCC